MERGKVYLIIRERETRNRLKAKGVLVDVDDVGLHIEDEKTEAVEVLSFEEMKMFVGKNINFGMADVVKEDISND